MSSTVDFLRSKAVSTVSVLKHNRIARMIMAPIMTAQFELRDIKYATSPDSLYIRKLKDVHRGQRCFIIGNGPSVTINDLDSLADEITFAANGITNLFSKTNWRPTYYLAVDREFIMHEASLFPSLPVDRIMVNWTPFSKKIQGAPKITLLNKRPARYSTKKYTTSNIFFSERPDLYVSEGYTVTYTALQLAIWMGFSEIYLVGIDHTYTHVADEDGNVFIADGVIDHCYEDAEGTHVNPQFRDGAEFAYRLALSEAVKRNIKIANATRGGTLEIFDRVNINSVLCKKDGAE